MEKYFINIGNDESNNHQTECFNSLTITFKQYTRLLCLLSEHQKIDAILKNQTFSCGTCHSFSLSAKSLYSTLQTLKQDEEIVVSISSGLRVSTDINPWYFELLDETRATLESLLDDVDDFYEKKDLLLTGEFIIEEECVYQFPFDECCFVFDTKCACNRILHS